MLSSIECLWKSSDFLRRRSMLPLLFLVNNVRNALNSWDETGGMA